VTASVTVVAAALLGIDVALAAGGGKDTAAITRGALGLASGREREHAPPQPLVSRGRPRAARRRAPGPRRT